VHRRIDFSQSESNYFLIGYKLAIACIDEGASICFVEVEKKPRDFMIPTILIPAMASGDSRGAAHRQAAREVA
jgi:hypothetical protein